MIIINEYSYSKALKVISNRLTKQGIRNEVSDDHRCVNVLDKNGNTIEQYYPEEVESSVSQRGKFINVGQGNGSYELVKVEYDRRNFRTKDPLIKTVSKTNKDKGPRF